MTTATRARQFVHSTGLKPFFLVTLLVFPIALAIVYYGISAPEEDIILGIALPATTFLVLIRIFLAAFDILLSAIDAQLDRVLSALSSVSSIRPGRMKRWNRGWIATRAIIVGFASVFTGSVLLITNKLLSHFSIKWITFGTSLPPYALLILGLAMLGSGVGYILHIANKALRIANSMHRRRGPLNDTDVVAPYALQNFLSDVEARIHSIAQSKRMLVH